MDTDWTTTHAAPDIVLDAIRVGYQEREILKGISAVLPRGRISVILGGSGGGKSTLLKAILGLLPPTSGRVLLGGYDLYALQADQLREIRKRLGVLFQDGALLGSLPLGENIALPIREHTNLDEDLIETMVRMKLSLVGLDAFMDFFPNQLSGGMRKRAGLARALALDPKVLLCDEPTSGLDPITAADLDRLILDLKEAFGMTIVVVSHDLESVYTIADHVVVLNKGAMVFQGDPAHLRQSEDPFLVQFLNRLPNRERHRPQAVG
ncbi:putative ribonucleotide transport ATP-binding protein mkl [Fundidesulfovibrio magnetotacticus]|uniref:Putative ribonucleotide transport ATP-binding protein mkl n=1 Tax=Fundidesulfovibrio magnetotacticus TaxID=2730080 RepID=A0A6V8M0G8_9BACT|nr:ATP-binding cassette domain-containing protein [Fundidesulfovibrio magnetotacticus]GFK95357.1 putative ribonucleotide transport ATP-binding protein mkl [Fundidesulfovibrio magnetotacticus]